MLPKGQAGASRAGTGRPGLTVAGAGEKPYTHPLTFSLTLGRQLGFLCHGGVTLSASGLIPDHSGPLRCSLTTLSRPWQSRHLLAAAWGLGVPGDGRQLTIALLVLLMAPAAAAVVAMVVAAVAAALALEPGLPVPADAAHDDGDAGEDDDHTYDGARHQHGRDEQVAVL